MNPNPYEPPKANLEIPTELANLEVVRIGNKKVFVPAGLDLPYRCVICNARASYPKKPKNLYYSRNYGLITFVVGFLLLCVFDALILISILLITSLIIGLVTRIKTSVSIGLCDKHHEQKMKNRVLCITLTVIIIGLVFFQLYLFLVFIFMISLICFLMISVTDAHIIVVKKNDKGTTLKGFKSPFLESLPRKY